MYFQGIKEMLQPIKYYILVVIVIILQWKKNWK